MARPPALELTNLPPPSSTLDDDIAIVVPPTPSHVLPFSETDGLTSGAVQPPGSTGEETKHEIVRVSVGESGEDTDGSTEDEAFEDGQQVDEWEDDEQRLIRLGGSGIPLGPVSLQPPVFIRHAFTHPLPSGRCPSTSAPCNICQTPGQEMSCPRLRRNSCSQ